MFQNGLLSPGNQRSLSQEIINVNIEPVLKSDLNATKQNSLFGAPVIYLADFAGKMFSSFSPETLKFLKAASLLSQELLRLGFAIFFFISTLRAVLALGKGAVIISSSLFNFVVSSYGPCSKLKSTPKLTLEQHFELDNFVEIQQNIWIKRPGKGNLTPPFDFIRRNEKLSKLSRST